MATETLRRDEAFQLGNLMIGCQALDKDIMMGGFERGSIVGVSASRPGALGELMAIQMIAEFMKKECPGIDGVPPKVHVTSTLAPGTFATALRDHMLKDLGSALEGGPDTAKTMVRHYLEHVIITQVVDIKDLVNVMCGRPGAETTSAPAHAVARSPKLQAQEVNHEQGFLSTKRRIAAFARNPVSDDDVSKGEDGDSVPSSPDPLSDGHVPQADPPAASTSGKQPLATLFDIEKAESWPHRLTADLVVVHNIGALIMNEYNKNRSKDAFHTNLKKLNSVLRSIARGGGTGVPLIVVLNNTSTPWPMSGKDTSGADSSCRTQLAFPQNLRPQYEDFFHPLVDVSLLCTRIESSHDITAAAEHGPKTGSQLWAVTVVKDEIGAWELSPDLSPKERLGMGGLESRELRFGIVAIKGGRIQSSLVPQGS